MSYRSSDAYSRRPTDDDRRGPDRRDSGRWDSIPRRGSDPYKDERYRRDTEPSARDRRHPTDSPREQLSFQTANPTKLHVATSSARFDSRTGTPSTPRSPADSPSVGKPPASENLSRLMRKHAAAAIDVARLSAQREPLETAMKARQAEYEKSMNKHADFPSVPEMHNAHRRTYAENMQKLEGKLRKAQSHLDSTVESLVQAILQACGAQSTEPEANKAAASALSQQHQEKIKKQETKITELETKLRKIETERLQERTELRTEFDRKLAEMKEHMEEMIKATKKDVKEIKALKGVKEEIAGEMKEQVAALRGEFEKRQTEQADSQRNNLQSQLSKHKEEVTEAVSKQLLTDRNALETALRSEISTLIREENSTLRSDISSLQSNLSTLQSNISTLQSSIPGTQPDVSGVLRRVDELAGELARSAQDTINLRNELSTCAQRVEEEARKVEEHESTLSRLDIDAAETAAEMSVSVPGLQSKVATLEAKLDGMSKEIDTKQQGLFERVETYASKMGTVLGQLVDGLQKAVTDYGARIQALEKASTDGTGPATAAGGQQASAEGPATNPGTASLKTSQDSIQTAIDRLTHDCAELSGKVGQAIQDLSAAKEDVNQQLEAVRHSIRVLDSQFSNLSTRSLAEYIIGHLEQLYPNARSLVADIDALKTRGDSLGSRVDSLEGRMRDFKGELDGLVEAKIEAKTDPSYVGRVRDVLLTDIEENARKRRRMDQPNGDSEGHVNGTG